MRNKKLKKPRREEIQMFYTLDIKFPGGNIIQSGSFDVTKKKYEKMPMKKIYTWLEKTAKEACTNNNKTYDSHSIPCLSRM